MLLSEEELAEIVNDAVEAALTVYRKRFEERNKFTMIEDDKRVMQMAASVAGHVVAYALNFYQHTIYPEEKTPLSDHS